MCNFQVTTSIKEMSPAIKLRFHSGSNSTFLMLKTNCSRKLVFLVWASETESFVHFNHKIETIPNVNLLIFLYGVCIFFSSTQPKEVLQSSPAVMTILERHGVFKTHRTQNVYSVVIFPCFKICFWKLQSRCDVPT